jgi:hypothetical protein
MGPGTDDRGGAWPRPEFAAAARHRETERAGPSPAEKAPGIFAGQFDEVIPLDQERRHPRLGGPSPPGELRTQADEVGPTRHMVAGRRPCAEIPGALSAADPEAIAVGWPDRAVLSRDDELIGILEPRRDRRRSKAFDQQPIRFIHGPCLRRLLPRQESRSGWTTGTTPRRTGGRSGRLRRETLGRPRDGVGRPAPNGGRRSILAAPRTSARSGPRGAVPLAPAGTGTGRSVVSGSGIATDNFGHRRYALCENRQAT